MRYQEPPKIEHSAQLARQIQEVLESGIYTNGPLVRSFESAFREVLGLKGECVALSSCTSGLQLVLKALGVYRPLIPDFTFCATAHAVSWACHGFKVGDCDERTFNLEPQQVGDCDAIVATHIFGNPCEHGRLEHLVEKNGFPIIYDAAHALGAKYNGTAVGDLGKASVFSLSPTKQITAGEGGMVVTQDSYLAEKIRKARNYGNEPDYDCKCAGINARMTEIQAIIGLESLRTFPSRMKHRKRLVEEYQAHFPEKMLQRTTPDSTHAWKDFSILVGKDKVEKVRGALMQQGIESKRYFRPISSLSCYNGSLSPCKTAKCLFEKIVQVPLHSNMNEDDCRRIAKIVLGAIA